jgi:hypothetical protein
MFLTIFSTQKRRVNKQYEMINDNLLILIFVDKIPEKSKYQFTKNSSSQFLGENTNFPKIIETN